MIQRSNNRYWILASVLLAGSSLAAYGVGYATIWVDYKIILAGIFGLNLTWLIWRKPIWGIYLLIFFLPFERIGSLDIGAVTVRISQVLAILTITSWLVKHVLRGKITIQRNPLLIPIGGFIAINIIGLNNALNFERGITVLAFTLFTILLSIFLPQILTKPQHIQTAVKVLFASTIVVCLFGLFQFAGDLIGLPTSLTGLREQYTKDVLGFPRVQSTALEPLYFANFLLIPISIAFSLLFSKKFFIKPFWLVSVLVLSGLNIILTVSRGGYIALAVMLFLLAIRYWKTILQPPIFVSGLLVSFLVGIAAWQFLNVGEQIDNYATHVVNIFDGASFVERVYTFEVAAEIWWQHPWVGIGPGGFGPYASYHPLIMPQDGFLIVNNEYIELLAETGILGFSLFCLVMFVLMMRSWKALRIAQWPPILFGSIVALIGILVQYNTFSILYIMHIWFLIGWLVSLQNLQLSKQ